MTCRVRGGPDAGGTYEHATAELTGMSLRTASAPSVILDPREQVALAGQDVEDGLLAEACRPLQALGADLRG
jgi:hypothetical protein